MVRERGLLMCVRVHDGLGRDVWCSPHHVYGTSHAPGLGPRVHVWVVGGGVAMQPEEVIQGASPSGLCIGAWQVGPCWVTSIEVTRNGQGGGKFRGEGQKKRLTWIEGLAHRPVWRLLSIKVAKSDGVV